MKLSISHTEMNMQYMIKSYHAPEPRVVNTNTTSRTVITEDLHPQSNNVSTETWCTISRHKYGRVISNDGPWVDVWWSMRASSFKTCSINPENVYTLAEASEEEAYARIFFYCFQNLFKLTCKISTFGPLLRLFTPKKNTQQKSRITRVPLLLTSSAHIPPAPAWLISYSTTKLVIAWTWCDMKYIWVILIMWGKTWEDQ